MTLKVLELFSGIGGTHTALKATGLDFEVVAAADINPNANTVYSHNFRGVKCLNKNIESFDGEKLLNGVDVLTMSPPCQPFTRNGLKLDLSDARTKPFVSVLEALKTAQKPVPFVFVENVKGFDGSEARDMLVETLTGRGYFVREFLLCPSQFGIANSRLRYYLIARLDKDFTFGSAGKIMTDIPPGYQLDDRPEFCATLLFQLNPPSCVEEVLSSLPTKGPYLTDPMLLKYAQILDIVTSSAKRTCCFTKAYAHYLEGTGSVFAENSEILDQVFASLPSLESDDEKSSALRSLKLRFFSPEEISRFMCFPREFSFPESVSERQRYRLLGNSVNVFVVGFLLKLLTSDVVDSKR